MNFSQPGRLQILHLIIVFWVIMVVAHICNYVTSVQNLNSNSGVSIRKLLDNIDAVPEIKRPIIHTIMDPISPYRDENVMKIWADSWADAGWDPVILTYANATRYHPEDQQYINQLVEADLDEEHWPRYMVYILMYKQGGGWYSDPYVLPLRSDYAYEMGLTLPNEGNFTAHNENRNFPDLLSGSEEEWNRMAQEMFGRLKNNNINNVQDLFKLENSVVSSLDVLKIRSRAEFCNATKDKIAVNTAQMAMLENVNPRGYVHFLKATRRSMSRNCKIPKIHTFFTPAFDNVDKWLMEVEQWKEAWQDAGWRPIVLTLEDAQRHPYFESFSTAFDAATFKISEYNRMCFYRWLAVAASGGGYLSDIDTLPLYSESLRSLELPHGGKFTSFQSHIPSLLSGSVAEWNRMSRLLYDSYSEHSHEFWSDMLALQEVNDKSDACIFRRNVIGIHEPYLRMIERFNAGGPPINPTLLKNHCDKTTGKVAMHFSHYSCAQVDFCHGNREHAAGDWIREWKKQCFNATAFMKSS